MNILNYLSQKKNSILEQPHPFARSSSDFKRAYCFGLAVLVYGYKDQLPVTLECFSSILNEIHFDKEAGEKLPALVKHHFDMKITDVFAKIQTKDQQYCFISDLYRLAYFGLISPTYCHDIISGYSQVFNFSSAEKTFLKEFTTLGFQTAEQLKKQTLSYYDTKLDTAVKLYETFTLAGYRISMPVLEYIYPAFSMTNQVENLVLDDGSIRRYESNLHIKGDVIISNCSTLVFVHSNVTIDGKIIIDNGKILIKHSKVSVNSCPSDYLIEIKDTPAIRIENATIDCNHQCAFLDQDSGQLKLQHSTIKNTTKGYGIAFSGNSADVSTSTFENCADGAFYNHSKKELFISSTTFQNCSGVHGGAIHSRSKANTTIYNCDFHNCHAKYLGGAVYFSNLKYGQNVIHCDFEDCTPDDSILFNAYEKDTLL